MLPQLLISVTQGLRLAPAGWGGVKVTVLAPACDDDTVGTICPRLLPTPVPRPATMIPSVRFVRDCCLRRCFH